MTYLTMLAVSQSTLCTLSNVNNGKQQIWKEVVMAYFEILSQHLVEMVMKITKNVTQDSW
jgi:hypothetical protein